MQHASRWARAAHQYATETVLDAMARKPHEHTAASRAIKLAVSGQESREAITDALRIAWLQGMRWEHLRNKREGK